MKTDRAGLLKCDRVVEDNKFQAPKTKPQTNSNFRNSKYQTVIWLRL